jgi:hypothetical protein
MDFAIRLTSQFFTPSILPTVRSIPDEQAEQVIPVTENLLTKPCLLKLFLTIFNLQYYNNKKELFVN